MAPEINEVKVPKRILNTLLASLTAGVVPRSGAPYIAIGRKEGLNAAVSHQIAGEKLVCDRSDVFENISPIHKVLVD